MNTILDCDSVQIKLNKILRNFSTLASVSISNVKAKLIWNHIKYPMLLKLKQQSIYNTFKI